MVLFFSTIISIVISYFLPINNDIVNIISVILSIIIGLMFNFSSSLSNKISSEHLTIKYKFKEIRLDKLELSYKSSYFSIYVSIISLIVCLILSAIDEKSFIAFKILIGVLVFFLSQMFLSFYFVLDDMKNFVDYDIKQEKKVIRKKREMDMNEDD